ncbi:MAG: AMP nucleosidase, partial [Bacteroidales bacterium]|nr:AMP nucleosidase [Bacteroidales bacterium]
MKTKKEIVSNWLPRYTGNPLEDFGDYILLTNFHNYMEIFCKEMNTSIVDPLANMQCA